MSGGYHGRPPSDYAELMADLARLRREVDRLNGKRAGRGGATPAATGLVAADSNGVLWRLGVTTSGATTWTKV